MNKIAPIDVEEVSAIDFLKVPDQHCITKSQHNETIKACKICLEEEILSPELLKNMSQTEAADHQLIVPCECSGSMGYVHQKCIRTWIEKQLASGDSKRAQCQICKSRLFYHLTKTNQCDCQLKNFEKISCCNIASAIIQVLLLGVVLVVYHFSDGALHSELLKYILIALIAILSLSFVLTVLIIVAEAFVKKYKFIGRIYSIEESQLIGLRQPRTISTRSFALSASQRSTFNKLSKIGSKKVRKSQFSHRATRITFRPIFPSNQ